MRYVRVQKTELTKYRNYELCLPYPFKVVFREILEMQVNFRKFFDDTEFTYLMMKRIIEN